MWISTSQERFFREDRSLNWRDGDQGHQLKVSLKKRRKEQTSTQPEAAPAGMELGESWLPMRRAWAWSILPASQIYQPTDAQAFFGGQEEFRS